MVSGPDFRKRKSRDYGSQSGAEQKLAIESLRNIANVSISGASVGGDTEDADVTEVVTLLRTASGPISVSEVARRLQWDSDKAANALARCGRLGLIEFSGGGGTTTVTLANP